MRSAEVRSFVAALGVALCAGGCVMEPPPPDAPLEGRVRLAPGAPEADPAEAPFVDGMLPEGVPANIEVHDLGAVAVSNGHTPEILIDNNDDVVSFTVIAYA